MIKREGWFLKIGIFDCPFAGDIISIIDKILSNFFDEVSVILIYNTDDICSEKFDVLIVNGDIGEEAAFSCETAVVTSDDARVYDLLRKANVQIITYGFNSRSSVTISGVSDDSATFCVQRSFAPRFGGSKTEPSEFSVKFENRRDADSDEYAAEAVLPAVTACLAAGAAFTPRICNALS